MPVPVCKYCTTRGQLNKIPKASKNLILKEPNIVNASSKWACFFHISQVTLVDKASIQAEPKKIEKKEEKPVVAAPIIEPIVNVKYTPDPNLKALIFDNGSGYLKAGFAGNDNPSVSFPNIIGHPKYVNIMPGSDSKDTYVGEEAQAKRGLLNLTYPIDHGIIMDWDAIESVWSHAFYNELRVMPEEYSVLLTEAPLNPKSNREKSMQIMFETFNVPQFYMEIQATLALYSTGRTTGIVLDIGDGVTHSVPIVEGYCLSHAVNRLDLAGRDITKHLIKLLAGRGYSFQTSAELEIARDIKEKHGYVALDFQKELTECEKNPTLGLVNYKMPDEQVISVGKELFESSEILFQPSMIGSESNGIHSMLQNSVERSDINVRRALYENVILSGGTVMTRGFSNRLEKELLNVSKTPVKVSNPSSKFSVWAGASILVSIPSFQERWITKKEFQEEGVGIVHRKCVQ